MAKVMMTVELDPEHASIADVGRKLHVDEDQIDDGFGVVNIDPVKHLYAVLVEERAAGDASKQDGVSGPYSNPRIESMAPSPRDNS